MLIRLSPAERSVRRPIRGGKGGYGVRGSTTDLGEGHSLVQAPGGCAKSPARGNRENIEPVSSSSSMNKSVI